MKIDITVQEILCWIGLFLVAANPYGIFNDLIQQVGMRVPLMMLAVGAGSEQANKIMKGGQ